MNIINNYGGFPPLMAAGNFPTSYLHTNAAVQYPPMGFTENLSATYLSSGNPFLDFFFHVVPDSPPSDLAERLQSS